MKTLNYFTSKDFENANPKCRIGDMKSHFLHRLDVARFHAGVPFIITSAFRTIEHEHSRGRDGSSSHTLGVAVDIAATNSRTRFKIIAGLLKAGFTRIGINAKRGFIHVDDDPAKDPEVIWAYD
jgi:uncharacterized protein YcbK (DUF882 family)